MNEILAQDAEMQAGDAAAKVTVRLSYLICAAPRTGSTLLAHALANTGRAGRPNEFFDIHDHNEQFWKKTLGVEDDSGYFDKAVAAGTTANGVFALKLLWHQTPAVLAKLKAAGAPVPDGDTAAMHRLLAERLGAPPKYIWMRRRNKLAQAISYLRASRTNIWRSTDIADADSAAKEPAFDFDWIAKYLALVNDFDAQWHAYFKRNKLKVLMVIYENFIAAYQPTILSALEFLGIAHEGLTVAPPRLQRQADARSAEWQRRFLKIARERGMVPEAAAAAETAGDAKPAEQKREKRARVPKSAAAPADVAPPLLIAYQLAAAAPPLIRAPRERDWMDATATRFAYRCLPMVIANQNGWLLLNRHKFLVVWSGGPDPAALKIEFLSGQEPRDAVSLFGGGILTFTTGYLFRTAPGFNLHVRGPANAPKDGIAALEGIVETDWSEATFTMNWKVTRLNHPLVFEEGEPFAMITPLRRGETETFQPELRSIAEDPELMALHREWASSRTKHNADLKVPASQARKEGWQRHYMRGVTIRKEPAQEHQTKLTLLDFTDKRR